MVHEFSEAYEQLRWDAYATAVEVLEDRAHFPSFPPRLPKSRADLINGYGKALHILKAIETGDMDALTLQASRIDEAYQTRVGDDDFWAEAN